MRFRVLIQGSGFRRTISGEVGRYGFMTTRFVEAGSTEEARVLGCDAVTARPDISAQVGAPNSTASVIAAEVDACDGGGPAVEVGLAWFLEVEH